MEQVIRYRTTSESAREAFLEYLTVLQSRLGSVGTDASYADSVADLVRNEVMDLTRFRGHLKVSFGGVHDGRQIGPVHPGV
jgi:hypothetical protein